VVVRSSRKFVEITCFTCGDKAIKRSDFVYTVSSEGRPVVCSRACAIPHRKPSVYKPKAFEDYGRKDRAEECTRCKKVFPISEFIKDVANKRMKFRKSFYCHNCRKIRRKEYMLKGKYQIESIEEFEEKLELQNGRCAICQRAMKRPCVDHNHTTGQIRALLCVQCNAMIGNSYEDKSILESAIKYLTKWEANDQENPSTRHP
jgi:hypothetical protein